MIRLPAHLERKLMELFPHARERNQFVAQAIENALHRTGEEMQEQSPERVGGTIHLFTDGGSRGNPGQAAIACILEDPSSGEVLREHYERIGIATNNVAEYRALIEGLKIARRYHPNHIVCHLDSELVVKQLHGEYRIKMHTLQPFHDQVCALAATFPDISFIHIRREDNFKADALVNRALDFNGRNN